MERRTLKQWVDDLGDSPFAMLEAEQLERLDAMARQIRRPPGSILYEEGESAVECFLTLAGVVEVFKRTESGGCFILQTARPGDLFGLDDIIAHSNHYQSSARVFIDAHLVGIPREEIFNLLEASPAFAAEILSHVADHACSLRGKLTDFVEHPVSERLMETLAELTELHGVSNGQGIKIELSLSNQRLADMVGATPETISTLLRELKDDGVIERKGQTFVIRQPEQLRAYVD